MHCQAVGGETGQGEDTETAGGGEDQDDPIDSDLDPEDADGAMRAALASRTIVKQPAAALSRRPAAADARGACVKGIYTEKTVRFIRRRPAAADARGACVEGINTEKTVQFFPHDKGRTKHQFCSGWYHKTRTRLRREGKLDDATIKQELRKVYVAAVKVWEEHN